MTSGLHILVVSDVSPAHIGGGGERVLWEQASRLVKLGHEVRILSRSPADEAKERVERQGVRIRHFHSDQRSLLRFVRSSILQSRRTAAQELDEAGADVLHLHQPLSGYGVLHSPPGRRIPSLYTFHSPAPLEYRLRRGMTGHHRGGWTGSLAMAVLWLIEGTCLRRATRIHVLSDFSTGLLWKLYRIPSRRIVKIPGGADTDRFQPAEDRTAIRNNLGFATGRPLLFTLRNLEARMGLDTLIQSMAILRRQAPQTLLLIGGAGSLRNDLESLTASLDLNEHVRFLGFVPDEHLPLYYQAADFFILPTRELEGFGLVTVEALACGTPVLGTPVGGTPEILRPLRSDLLFSGMEPDALAHLILEHHNRFCSDPTGYQDLRLSCRRHALERYAWPPLVKSLEQVFREVTAARFPPDP
ncbi:glycosyltransferase family 4 protein [Candidatus Methylomirabilis sp.]|uniref:glycosyltransferase family 4 protein n=1 Tax=Candidatus Methylomirabilis sp. TaxID=2032687 RepID=UPI002A66DCF5|nr:glycosyltransferase family 4 protein [Candidatus Methylomirabilis sp.]